MSCRNVKAVVLWTQEKKVGIEPLSSVPEGSRFVGAVTPVKFSGDKKWYPAKLIFISDDEEVLDLKAKEVAAQIVSETEKEEHDRNVSKNKSKRKGKKTTLKQGSASEKEIACALGVRPPVPAELQPAKAAASKLQKDKLKSHSLAQQNLDTEVRSAIKKNLFPDSVKSNCSTSQLVESSDGNLSEVEGDSSDEASKHDSNKDLADDKDCCRISQLLHKHCNPTTTSFLKDLTFIFEQKGNVSGKKFLTLLPIPDKLKKVELYPNRGVYIAASDKDSLKVDFKNKPSSLIRETLFCLFGKRAFQAHTVTARGTKAGSYGIEDEVLKAVCDFTNRNCEPSKHMKFNKMVASINKRAPEWRGKGTPSPLERKRKFQKSKVVSTSPFKCTPLKKHGVESGGDTSDDDDKDPGELASSSTALLTTPTKDSTKRPVSCSPSKHGTPAQVSSPPPGRSSPNFSQVCSQPLIPPQGPNPQWSTYHSYNSQGQIPHGQIPQGQIPPGHNPQGQGHNPQGYNPQGYNPQGYNPQGYNPQGYNPQGYNPQGYNPQGYNSQCYNPPNLETGPAITNPDLGKYMVL